MKLRKNECQRMIKIDMIDRIIKIYHRCFEKPCSKIKFKDVDTLSDVRSELWILKYRKLFL